MKQFHMHVGSERCGSTLIQSFFNEANVGQVFARFGVRYDAQIYLAIGELIPFMETDEARFRVVRERHIVPYMTTGPDRIFSTHEVFLGLDHEKAGANSTEFMCDCLQKLLEGFDVRPLIVFRRQDTFIESLYNQLLKRGETREFSKFLEDLPLENYRWDRVADIFAERFGKGHVSVIPFEKGITATGGYDNYLNAIFGVLEMPVNVDMATVPVMNPSLAPRALEVQRQANMSLTGDEAHNLANWLELNVPKRPSDSHVLLNGTQRMRILDFYADSNRRLFAEYMPKYAVAGYLSL